MTHFTHHPTENTIKHSVNVPVCPVEYNVRDEVFSPGNDWQPKAWQDDEVTEQESQVPVVIVSISCLAAQPQGGVGDTGQVAGQD